MWSDNSVYTDNRKIIENFVSLRSASMSRHLKEASSHVEYGMWYKTLTHSDLTTRGKRTNSSDGFEKNLLYYLSVSDMKNLQRQFPEKVFESAKQSNIGMPEDFYLKTGIPRIKRRKGAQTENHNWEYINDYMNVYLVIDSSEFFTLEYTEKIQRKLGKTMPQRWKSSAFKQDFSTEFMKIDLHEAIHGLGTEKDCVFHTLRLSMFLNDAIILIYEKDKRTQSLYLILEKNVNFYTILGLKDETWAKNERVRRFKERAMIREGIEPSISTDIYDNEWDNILLP